MLTLFLIYFKFLTKQYEISCNFFSPIKKFKIYQRLREWVQCRNTIFKYNVVSLFDISHEIALQTTSNISLNKQVDISTHIGCSEDHLYDLLFSFGVHNLAFISRIASKIINS